MNKVCKAQRPKALKNKAKKTTPEIDYIGAEYKQIY